MLAAWPDLIALVQRAIDAGTDPPSPQAQSLAAEWMRLLAQFHGDDPGPRNSLYIGCRPSTPTRSSATTAARYPEQAAVHQTRQRRQRLTPSQVGAL